MKQWTTRSVLCGLCILAASCTSSKKIYERISAEPVSMAYGVERAPVHKIPDINILVNTTAEGLNFPEKAKVTKEKGYVIPLLIFNTWKSVNHCEVGREMLHENLEEFVHSSLCEFVETESHGVVATQEDSTYELKLNIDSASVTGPYKSSGYGYFLLFVYGYGYSDVAGPATAKLSLAYTLTKNNVPVLENTVHTETFAAQQSYAYSSNSALQENYGTKMVQALSECIAKSCSTIVQDVNEFLLTQGKPVNPNKKEEQWFDPSQPLKKLQPVLR